MWKLNNKKIKTNVTFMWSFVFIYNDVFLIICLLSQISLPPSIPAPTSCVGWETASTGGTNCWKYSSKTTTTSPKSSETWRKRIYLEVELDLFLLKMDGIQSQSSRRDSETDSDIILKRDGKFWKKAPWCFGDAGCELWSFSSLEICRESATSGWRLSAKKCWF